MLQIRNSFFETNSSSANILIIPKDQGIHVPKRFFYMDDDTSLKPTEKLISHATHSWSGTNREVVDKIVNFLYLAGVEEIVYGGKNYYWDEVIQKYKNNPEDKGLPSGWTKEQLTLALFGDESYIKYFEEGSQKPVYDENNKYRLEDYENYYVDYYVG